MTVWAGRFSPPFLYVWRKKGYYTSSTKGCFSIVMLVFWGVDLNLSRVVFFGQVNFFFWLNVGEKPMQHSEHFGAMSMSKCQYFSFGFT